MRLRPPSDTGIQDVVRVAAGSVESTIIVQVPTVRRLGILYNSSSMEGERSLVTCGSMRSFHIFVHAR